MLSRFALAAFAAVLAVGLHSGTATAAEHVVKMLNQNDKGEYMVFEPDYLKVEVGDTIKFEPVDPGHNAETIPEIWPEGAETFKGEISQPVSYTVEKEGVYGIKCLPHFPMGMMMLVVAGEPANKDQLDSFTPPEMAKERYDALKSKVE
jgi:pseudoazurin